MIENLNFYKPFSKIILSFSGLTTREEVNDYLNQELGNSLIFNKVKTCRGFQVDNMGGVSI